MLLRHKTARADWIKEFAGYWRELLFWTLLLPAFGALESPRPNRQIAGLIDACAFLVVAISFVGKLNNLGLEYANWNRLCRRAAAVCIGAGFLAGGSVVTVASFSQQRLGTESGWNKAMLAIALGPVLEEVIFRGYILTVVHLLTQHLSPSRSAAFSIVGASIVFAIAHLTTSGTTALQLCCIVFTGCLYGCLRFRHGSTAAAALGHGAYNLALYVSYWSGISR